MKPIELSFLGAETVEGLALTLKGVDNVQSGDSLALGVLGVSDRVANNVLKEGLEYGASLLVHHTGDALDTTTACQTADGGLGDAVDVVAKHLAVTLAGFADAFSRFARHVDNGLLNCW